MSLQTDSRDQRSPGTHDGGSRDDGSPRGRRVSDPILLPFSHIQLRYSPSLRPRLLELVIQVCKS